MLLGTAVANVAGCTWRSMRHNAAVPWDYRHSSASAALAPLSVAATLPLSLTDRRQPSWSLQPCIDGCADAPAAADWLTERGSMTQRLRRCAPDTRVTVEHEGVVQPWPDEAERLGLAPDLSAWVRVVALKGAGRVLLRARTVIPGWGPDSPWAVVQRLGRQPLGELLFTTPGLQRSAFEFARTCGLWSVDDTCGWPVRRCVFQRDGAPLLLTEALIEIDWLCAAQRAGTV